MKIKPACALIVWLMLLCNIGFSQDVIFFKDGTKDSVIVLEIGTELIAYKKFHRQDRPVYKVYKKDISLIEFADGRIEVLETSKKQTEKKIEKEYIPDWYNNIISINVFGLFISNAHIGYERLSLDGNFGLRVNLVKTLHTENKKLSMLLGGLDFNFYPSGQKRISYFLGPAVRYGTVNYSKNRTGEQTSPIGALLFNNGLSFNSSKHFYMAIQLGGGLGMINTKELVPYGYLMFNVGGKL